MTIDITEIFYVNIVEIRVRAYAGNNHIPSNIHCCNLKPLFIELHAGYFI